MRQIFRHHLRWIRLCTACLAYMAFSMAVNAGTPNVHVNEKFPSEGKTIKVAYSDVFSTLLNGENVKMRIIYTKLERNLPALLFELLSPESKPYKSFYEYLEKLVSVQDKLKVTGKRICDITLEGKHLWMLGVKYAVAGSSLAMVRYTYDEIDPNKGQCMAITLPLTILDSNKFDWNGKSHHNELLKSLKEEEFKDIEYKFYTPDGNIPVTATLPFNSDMALTIQKLMQSYK